MIKDILKIHDKFSVEIKQSYYSQFEKKKSDYRVLTYLFIPSALNINEQTYSKEQFYKDIRVNVRYNTPEYTFSELINNKKSPLIKIDKAISKLVDNPSKSQFVKVETLGKIFATVFSSAIRNTNRIVRKKCSKGEGTEAIEEFVSQIKEISNIYRSSLKKMESASITEYQKALLYFGDEFVSNVIEHQVFILYKYVTKHKDASKSVLANLLQLLKQEQSYIIKNYQEGVSVDSINSEKLIFKRSQLKKYIDSILFLNKDTRKDGTFVEQSIFAFAAGLAMLFSTGIAFYYQQKYGNFTSAFFVALVISYMLKDRIKGIVSGLFISKAHSFYYDYKISILNSDKNKVGGIKENFLFVPFKKLGPKIKEFRFANRTLKIDNNLFGEHIIQYKKRIELFPKKLGEEMFDDKLNSIVDITRINLYRFTQNMDNPKKAYFFIKDDEIIKSEADKVYHINIIQKFYTEDGVEFKRYRVVINREGIKRIDKIKQNGLNVLYRDI